ncbi:PaaI family thioesterase [Kordiimonas pumila]|uniref:PaaI family thioesterase n=1 Tax=Kordiimonas pumila TaxID=2161677 RepID=A0ABV7D3N6_9PROT|nr:PaaI family thioesterase [Kordiimonas pumila]
MTARRATPAMIVEANPPAGFEPILSNSEFGWLNGPMFEKSDEAGWRRGFRVTQKHANVGGNCHGGMIMTFADIVASRAVMDVGDPPFVTVRLVTDFVHAAFIGDWLEGEARAEMCDEGLVAIQGMVRCEGREIASISGLFKLMRKRA